MKNGTHLLKLIGYMASSLFTGVTKDNKMGSANFQPTLRPGTCENGENSEHKGKQDGASGHMFA
jgi:hypothetical protein